MIIKFYGFQNISFSSIDEKLKFENFNNKLKFSQEMVDLLKNLSFGKILTIRLDSKSLKSPTSLKYVIITSNYNKRVLCLLDKNSLKSRINKLTIIDNCTLTNKEINDFEKELRKDVRWQYTNNAKKEVADTTLRVLQDFGFQG
jgi:hypothetical protein